MYLAEIFCDHMVLQRDKEICIFGYGEGEGTIEFCGNIKAFSSNTEKFCVYLPPCKAGGPFDMKVTLNGVARVIGDIMIGDVYIAAGQSNIEFTLGETVDIEYYSNNNIRFFTEPNTADEEGKLIHNDANWFSCEGKNLLNFSAIGYYFANDLQNYTNIPIGIISCSKGASRVDAWTAPEYVSTSEYQKMQEVKHNDYCVYKFNHNSWLYQNKLLNIVPFANAGVLWYQGESNRGNREAKHYARMLEIMIKNWRDIWNDELPFYCVQLMPYNENPDVADWALIREQQEKASKTISGVYMVTLVNTGEADEIHPQKKKTVACELANAVKNIQFNQNVEYCGPILDGYKLLENGVELNFSHSEGLHINGDELLDLCVISQDKELISFEAVVTDNSLKILFGEKALPTKISLGYCNAPEHNLFNSAGYLASPFTINLT